MILGELFNKGNAYNSGHDKGIARFTGELSKDILAMTPDGFKEITATPETLSEYVKARSETYRKFCYQFGWKGKA